MAKKALPCPTVLRQLLRYEPETGKLFWREREPHFFTDGKKTAAHHCAVWNAKYSGRESFTSVGSHGYNTGSVFNKKLQAHRVVVAICDGEWPQQQVDHINGIKTDNRRSNLRNVTNAENAKNMSRSSANKSGVTGVFWLDNAEKWIAYIGVRGKSRKNLGRFEKFSDAVAARKRAEKTLGYHPNHGKG